MGTLVRNGVMILIKCRENLFEYNLHDSLDVVKVNERS